MHKERKATDRSQRNRARCIVAGYPSSLVQHHVIRYLASTCTCWTSVVHLSSVWSGRDTTDESVLDPLRPGHHTNGHSKVADFAWACSSGSALLAARASRRRSQLLSSSRWQRKSPRRRPTACLQVSGLLAVSQYQEWRFYSRPDHFQDSICH